MSAAVCIWRSLQTYMHRVCSLQIAVLLIVNRMCCLRRCFALQLDTTLIRCV